MNTPIRTVFHGYDIIESSILPRPAKIAVLQLYLKDGTRLLRPEFIAHENMQWRALYGQVDEPTAYRIGDQIFAPPEMMARLRKAIADGAEREIVKAMTGNADPPPMNTAESQDRTTLTLATLHESYLRHLSHLLQRKAKYPFGNITA